MNPGPKDMIPEEAPCPVSSLFRGRALKLAPARMAALSWSRDMSVRSDKLAAAADARRRGDADRKLVWREDRDAKSVLVKISIAIAISFAGFVASQLRPRAARPTARPSPDQTTTSDGGELEIDVKKYHGSPREELRIIISEEASPEITNSICTATTAVGLSPASNSSGDEERFLLPEFNDFIMQELEMTSNELKTARVTTIPEEAEVKEEATEQEIAHLRELVLSLKERESSLQLQLLDYQGVREHEVAVRELENRLKISALEFKMHILKIDSLQADNVRLQSQMEDYLNVMKELEVAKGKIKRLEQKLKLEEEKAKEILASLHQKISALKQREQKDEGNHAALVGKLKRLEELEAETVELRLINSRLAEEKSLLARNLESTQTTVSTVLKDEEVEANEEVKCLRKVNEKLMEEIEQLQTDRCADVEELVYLRWLNACLRYELRNYQPSGGKTVARDLSRTMSPNSEEKAKQLVREYANLVTDGRYLNLTEIVSECSSSQASSGEPEGKSVDASSPTRQSTAKKAKFLGKLKKKLLGKGKKEIDRNSAGQKISSSTNSERRASVSTCSADEVIGRDSYDSSSSCLIEEVALANLLAEMEARIFERQYTKEVDSQINSRLSLDVQSLRRLELDESREENGIPHKSDHVRSYRDRKISLLEDTFINGNQINPTDQEDTRTPEKAELKKFADALRSSRGLLTLNRRSASCRY